MALGREIQDFLNAYGAVDKLATNASKRAYYANKGTAGVPTNAQLAGISPPGWLGGAGQQPGLLRRVGNAIGVTAPAAPAVAPAGSFGSGNMGAGGALNLVPPVSAPAGQGGAYDPDDPDNDLDLTQTYAGGGEVEVPALPPPMQYDENGQPVGWGAPAQADVNTSEPPIPMPPAPGAAAPAALPPYENYPGRDAVLSPAPATAPVMQGALPITRKGTAPAAPAKRKALNDQTRTEAYDPELDGPTEALPVGRPNGVAAPAVPAGAPAAGATPQTGDMAGNPAAGLSTNNARSDLENAIDGGLKFAQRVFHLDGSNVAVGEDPHKKGGTEALMTGVGAATPDMVRAMDGKINSGVPQGPNQQQIYAIRRLEAIYRWKSMNGDKAGADKAAFELLQFSAGVASQFGGQAVQQYKAGDVPGAVRSIQAGYNQIPDGRHMDVQGSTATIVDTRTGQPVQQIQFTPQEVFNAAMGLHNRSLYWQVLAQRVSPQPKASNRTEAQEDLDRARAALARARAGNVGKGRGGGGGAPASVAAPLIDKVNSLPRPAGTAPTQPATPPQGGGEEPPPVEPEPAEPEGETFLEAPPDLKGDAAPPDSVLRLKRAGVAPAGPNPPPASAPAAVGAPAPSLAAGGRQSADEPGPGKPGKIAAEPAPDPDAVPDQEVFRNGDRYAPTPAPGTPKAFDEPAPTGVPKELLDAQAEAAKLTAKQGGPAARSLIASRIKEWNDYNKSYASRKKAFEAGEAKRVQQEAKQAQTERREAAKEAHGYNLRPQDVQAIDDKVSEVYNTQAEKFPDAVKQLGDPVRVRGIATDIAQRNKLSAEQALRFVDKITTTNTDTPNQRPYKAWGRDPLGNVIVTMEGAPPLHLSPHIFKAVTEVAKARQAAIAKTVEAPKPSKLEPIATGVGQVIDNAKRDLSPLAPPYFGYDRSKFADPVTGRNPVNPAKQRGPRATPRVIE